MSASPAAAAHPTRAWPIEVMLVDGTALHFAMDPLPGLAGRANAAGIARLIAKTDLAWISGHILIGPSGHETYPRHQILRECIVWIDDIGFAHPRAGWEAKLTEALA